VLAFPPRDPDGLDAVLRAQLDPASPAWRHWLAPGEFADRFGVPADTYEAAVQWLEAAGFARIRRSPGRLSITFDATAGGIERVFGSPMRSYRWHGALHAAPEHGPRLPSFGDVTPAALLGLETFPAMRPRVRRSGQTFLAPADVQRVFGLDSVYAGCRTGAGESIAVIGSSDFHLADVKLFRSTFGLPAPTVKKLFVAKNPGINTDGEQEILLDVEWAGAIAPGAKILAVIAPNATIGAIADAVQTAVGNNLAPIVSLSFGLCEPILGGAEASVFDSYFREAAAQGQSVVVATGDTGAADCFPQGSEQAVNALAASPWVTAVGGTRLDPLFDAAGNATGYGGETAWNDGGDSAGGGGRSIFFGKPDWQAGPGVPADGARDVPDVAFAASPANPGYGIVVGKQGLVLGGVSFSTPIWGGLIALLAEQQGGPLGLVNPVLYRLGTAQAAGGPAVFHDVTNGTNAIPRTPGFDAGPGYDLVTGWGSFDAPALMAAFANQGPPPGPACDDGDPCTSDACGAGGACLHVAALGDGAVACVLGDPPPNDAACAGNQVPTSITRRLSTARTLLASTAAVKVRKARLLVGKAQRLLGQAAKAARGRKLSRASRS
jgi:subtilase family serine protease